MHHTLIDLPHRPSRPLTAAVADAAGLAWTALREGFRRWRALQERRRIIQDLLKHDDRTLYDIGYSRGSLNWALDQSETPDLLAHAKTRARREYKVAPGKLQQRAGAPVNPL
jgi:uncharacterized protein YjiS (DUF1127 family)